MMLIMALIVYVQLHGAAVDPAARQYYCQSQLQSGGYTSNSCKQIAQQLNGSTYPFHQYHEYSINIPDYNNINSVQNAIPTGTLCSANDPLKDVFNQIRSDWQRKTVQIDPSNPKITIDYKITAPHSPSFWELYISKEGYDASSKALGWEDLILADSLDQPNSVGINSYTFKIPNRCGQVTFYLRWQRIDAVGEGFYNCIDVNLDNGTGCTDDFDEEIQTGGSVTVDQNVGSSMFKAYQTGNNYFGGDCVNYQGTDYIAKYWTNQPPNNQSWNQRNSQNCSCNSYINQSQCSTNPTSSNNQFPSQNNNSNNFQEYDSNKIYQRGECVKINDRYYFSQWMNTKTNPLEQCYNSAPWIEVGILCNENSRPNEQVQDYNLVLDYFFQLDSNKQIQMDDSILNSVQKHFKMLYLQARMAELYDWRNKNKGRLAEVIILTHFSEKKADYYTGLQMAIVLSQEIIKNKLDLNMTTQEKTQVYLPLLKSESMIVQEISLQKFSEMGTNLEFAQECYNIIKRFGRYPQRNEILQRMSINDEILWLQTYNGKCG